MDTYNNVFPQEEDNTVNTCHLCVGPIGRTTFSVVGHFAFLICIGLIIWSRQHHDQPEDLEQQPNYYIYYVIASIFAASIYIGLIVEAAGSETCKFLKHVTRDSTPEEYIESIRNTAPTVRWEALCYHYDKVSHGQQGLATKEKVITCRESELCEFSEWRDLTRDIKGLFDMEIIRVCIHTTVAYLDLGSWVS